MTSELSAFISDVRTELGCSKLVKFIGTESRTHGDLRSLEYIIFIDLTSDEYGNVVALAAADREMNTSIIWSLELTLDVIKRHMEEEVGICDENGIKNFGRQFCRAIKSGCIIFDDSYAKNEIALFPLNLYYEIGELRIGANLQLPLLQAKLPLTIFRLLCPEGSGYESSLVEVKCKQGFSKRSNPETEIVSAAGSSLSQVVDSALNSEDDTRDAIAVRQVKRRKGGGVNLFASSRRK
jgi:hypothetical protein